MLSSQPVNYFKPTSDTLLSDFQL